MMDDAAKEAMIKRFRAFSSMWNEIAEDKDFIDPAEMIMCYYLDVIAGQLMELNNPKRVILPPPPGRN